MTLISAAFTDQQWYEIVKEIRSTVKALDKEERILEKRNWIPRDEARTMLSANTKPISVTTLRKICEDYNIRMRVRAGKLEINYNSLKRYLQDNE